MINKLSSILIVIILSTLLTSCSGEKMSEQSNKFPSIKDVPDETWEKLSNKKIYFGHQSVGFNIIDGIKELMKEYPQIKLNIVETKDSSKFNSGIFAHSRVGKNIDPKSKIDGLVKFMDDGLGNEVDIIFLKLCYVDIKAETNVQVLFNEYSAAMSLIKERYPQLSVLHFTNPLTKVQSGPKSVVKRLIGKPLRDYDDNVKRNEYNELLKNKYEGKEHVFDLALIESTFPDGSRTFFTTNGKTYYSLAPIYTEDGGHLNDIGKKVVAEQFLMFLANAIQ